MISLAPPYGQTCPDCGHDPQDRIMHRHLDGGEGAICAVVVRRTNPDGLGPLCGCPCPADPDERNER